MRVLPQIQQIQALVVQLQEKRFQMNLPYLQQARLPPSSKEIQALHQHQSKVLREESIVQSLMEVEELYLNLRITSEI